jgi:hypothetical protein
VTTATMPTIALLRNVVRLAEMMKRVMVRPGGLPGLATFSGPSGYGKSMAAIHAANRHRAYHVQCKSVWTRKALCEAILGEMGIRTGSTIPGMVDQIGQELSLSGRPLIVDEADYLIPRSARGGMGGLIEVIRDVYESSQGTIILIGEDALPTKLQAYERVHGRMLDMVQAEPAGIEDARQLVKVYARTVEVSDDLLAEIVKVSAGSVRRICVNLDTVRDRAENAGRRTIDLAGWRSIGGGEFFTGRPPAARPALLAPVAAAQAGGAR